MLSGESPSALETKDFVSSSIAKVLDAYKVHIPEPMQISRSTIISHSVMTSSKSVELGAVLPQDLGFVLVTQRREPFVGQALRIRPRGLRMWVVAGPHDVVDTDVVPLPQPHRVLHERAEDL